MLTVAARLNLGESVIEELVQINSQGAAATFDSISVDHFQYISDWHHFAILECVTLHDFESRPEWFAQKLRITTELAASALQRLNLLQIDEQGEIKPKVRNHTTIDFQVPSFAHTEHDRQLLNKALHALDETPKDRRVQTSMTMAIPESRLEEARQKTIEFERSMMQLLQRRGKRDSVYHVSVSFFPLTPKN